MLETDNIKNKNRGFTLLEVITAIFILTVGIGGAFALLQQTLVTASSASFRLTASYLAQEGLELTKNMRDGVWLSNIRKNPDRVWNASIPNGVWQADYQSTQLNTGYNATPLNIDGNGFYSYSAGTPSPFIRKITVQDVLEGSPPAPNPDKKEIIVDVYWEERGRTHTVEISEIVTNWIEGKLQY